MNESSTINVDDDKLMKQYEILTNIYNGRLSALQNILTIQSVFISAAILVIFSDLNGINILISRNGAFDRGGVYTVVILSTISFIISLFSLVSFMVQWNNCESLRKKLLKYEIRLKIDRINERSGLKIPLLLSAIILLISTVIFLVILIQILI